MKPFLLSLTLLLCFVHNGKAQNNESNSKPSIALLGMFHFGETSDLAAIKMTNLRDERRQREIGSLVNKLAAYQPTKVLVEYPLQKQDTLQKRYESYLAGDYTLGDSETYQIGFRLAKKLGHSTIYAMDHKMKLPFDELTAHLATTNEMEKMSAMVGMINELMTKESAALEELPLANYLLRINSNYFDRLANSLYLKEVLEMGAPGNEVGAKVSALWYQRNMVMLKNITSYIESPQERILVIVGSSHRAVIKDYIHDRLDLTYVEIAKFLD